VSTGASLHGWRTWTVIGFLIEACSDEARWDRRRFVRRTDLASDARHPNARGVLDSAGQSQH